MRLLALRGTVEKQVEEEAVVTCQSSSQVLEPKGREKEEKREKKEKLGTGEDAPMAVGQRQRRSFRKWWGSACSRSGRNRATGSERQSTAAM